MREFLWRLVARIVSRPAVASWLIERSKRTPYYPIRSRDGSELYMDRHWLFNPYGKDAAGNVGPARWERWGLPSIRVHHILRADDDAHLHDHPWNARTIVLRGSYFEQRPGGHGDALKWQHGWPEGTRSLYHRTAGYTGRVLFNSYHRISEVSEGGVFTLWFTWSYRGTWGFLVGGKKVPYRVYLGERE